eukprot:sb/3468930/
MRGRNEPTDTSKQPIRTRYLGHATGYQPIRDQYFLIWSVPDKLSPGPMVGQPLTPQPGPQQQPGPPSVSSSPGGASTPHSPAHYRPPPGHPGMPPPGSMPPGSMPPGSMPPGPMMPGTMPPGAMPPGAMAPGGFPGPPHPGMYPTRVQFASHQFNILRAQIYAYKLLSRNQPLTEHVVQALHGKRVLMAPGSGPGAGPRMPAPNSAVAHPPTSGASTGSSPGPTQNGSINENSNQSATDESPCR